MLNSVFGAPGKATSAPRPSSKLYIPSGDVEKAWRSLESPYAGVRSRKSGAQKAGLAYQKRIGDFLSGGDHPWTVDAGPWFCYHDASLPRRYCQPDFLLDDPAASTTLIVEVKIRWTVDAWWQLRKLYEPVVRKALGRQFVVPLVICRGYDPHFAPPEEVTLVDDLMDAKPSQFNLLVVR